MKRTYLIPLLFYALFPNFLNAQSEQKTGSIHPNVISIDFDKCEPFQEGFAIVSKGEAQGIIDKKGNFLVPYGTYTFGNIPTGFINGLCHVQIKKGMNFTHGFIDKSGKLVVPCVYEDATPFNDDGYAYVTKTQKKISDPRYVVIDKSGKETRLNDFGELYYEKKTFRMWGRDGIVDHTLKLIVPIKFEDRSPFQDGLAAVAKRNEFKEMKWGFVDTNGKTIIPFQFTYKPGDFHNGLALVRTANNTEFDQAYINRKGEIKIRIKNGKVMSGATGNIATKPNGEFKPAGFTEQNYTTYLFDSLGNIVNLSEAVLKKNASLKIDKIRPESFGNSTILFTAKLGKGLANSNGDVLIAPLFSKLSHFDSASYLAYAEYHLGNNKYTVGYVNAQGLFVIVKKEDSKW